MEIERSGRVSRRGNTASRGPRVRSASAAALLVLLPALGGCAFHFTDESGAEHYIGLVNLKIKAKPDASTHAGSVITSSTAGLFVSRSEQASTISVGLHRESLGYLRNNVLSTGNPFNLDPEHEQ